MDTQFLANDIVFYFYGDNKKNIYEIVSSEANTKLINSKFIFGYDNEGNPMNNYYGKFDFVLAEYDKSKIFIKNIACLKEEISKDGNFAIDENKATRI